MSFYIWEKPSIYTAADFKYALVKYSLKTEYDVKLYKSTTKKLGAICSSKECPWRVYCSFEKSRNKLMIKVYTAEHVCNKSGYSKMVEGPRSLIYYSNPLHISNVGSSLQHSTILGSLEDNPLDHIDIFHTYPIHVNVSKLEFSLLTKHTTHPPTNIAFVGFGPMPLSSITLAKFHLPNTGFYNFDIDPPANALASHLVSRDPDLSRRLIFHTTDLLNITTEVLHKEAKVKAIEYLEKHMAPEALLMLRSGFEVLTIYHPTTSEVINSVVIARKLGGQASEKQ
ncbi:hypothetical protein YC2023_011811 [Brassica napus]